MNRSFYRFAAVALASTALTAYAAEPALPKAETILDRFVEVTGGKAAYEKIKSEHLTLEMEFVGKGMKGTISRWWDQSNNSYDSADLEGIGKIESGVYNGQAWENSSIMGPRLKSGAERADAIREATFNAPLHWRKMYVKVETLGMETVNGEECYKLALTPAEGKPHYDFYSKKTGLAVKSNKTAVTQMGELEVSQSMADYKPINGILGPTKVTQSMMGSDIAVKFVNSDVNVDIPKSKLEPPAEIKKLIEAAK